MQSITFNQTGNWQALRAAQAWCKEHGVSFSKLSRAGIALKHGTHQLKLLSDMTEYDRKNFIDGTILAKDFNTGPVTIHIEPADRFKLGHFNRDIRILDGTILERRYQVEVSEGDLPVAIFKMRNDQGQYVRLTADELDRNQSIIKTLYEAFIHFEEASRYNKSIENKAKYGKSYSGSTGVFGAHREPPIAPWFLLQPVKTITSSIVKTMVPHRGITMFIDGTEYAYNVKNDTVSIHKHDTWDICGSDFHKENQHIVNELKTVYQRHLNAQIPPEALKKMAFQQLKQAHDTRAHDIAS